MRQQSENETVDLSLEQQQIQDMWWEDHRHLAALGQHLAGRGWSLAEFAKAIEEPWHLVRYWEDFTRSSAGEIDGAEDTETDFPF